MKMIKEQKTMWLFMVIGFLAVALVPEFAMAQAFSENFTSIVGNATFSRIITFGLYMVAGYSWFVFFQNFKLDGALLAVVPPAVLLFLAMKWKDVIKWAFQ